MTTASPIWPVHTSDVETPDRDWGYSAGWYVWWLGEIMDRFELEDEAKLFAATNWGWTENGAKSLATVLFVEDPFNWRPEAQR